MSTSSSNRHFIMGDGWAAYSGPYADHESHAHVAIQLIVARTGIVSVILDDQVTLAGRVLILGPRVRHRMVDDGGAALLLYLETHTALASRLLTLIAPADAAVAPQRVTELLRLQAPPACVIAGLAAGLGVAERRLDPRLEHALLSASRDPAPGAIGRAARTVGLSPARLRVLAQAQMQAPLSQWLLWRKLQRAGREMAAGAGLAEAAVAGGFADQAHLNRITKRMFGVTPLQASSAMRSESNRFVQ
ncbi:MAG: helix-turn-helix domain-containing protein [Alphaproteobacteria bacterium]|uniref:Helix-turn-helix domain-containing protein n=1 Tax=Brevundimonas aurifodinae TaxID=1508312 RepID=A0ABV1NJY9_9CAUL|nr:helix-turn-helix domain-containing protein [Alphaproteobacteria bacterium]MBU2291466.1 helix-turn-helix domain-containing protein [Alphaproteobacteria bacterium]MBU2396783.1 helix-turn-helix domain-containing protein [Alphaproteobacteria bacterium]